MKRLFLSLMLLVTMVILVGCGKKEEAASEFSAIGRINVVQDVDESTKATLRLFTTKKYKSIKVNKIDSPETFAATVSEPKVVVIRKGNQKRTSYYYTITITFSGPAQFTKVELSLDDVVKTYNIGRFECKEINKTGYEIGDYLEVHYDIPFENYQEAFASEATVPIRITNTGDKDIVISSIKGLSGDDEYKVTLFSEKLHGLVIKADETVEVTKLHLGVNADDLIQIGALFEIIYQFDNKPHMAVSRCSFGLQDEMLENEILPAFVEADLLNNGKVCTLEEDLETA